MNTAAVRAGWFLTLFAALAIVAWLSPMHEGPSDRDVYETSARDGIIPDCAELHCFRLLVPWTLGAVPGPSLLKWKLYAAAGNAAAAVAVFELALAFGVSVNGARLAMFLSAFGFGSLYTLFDPYTADPLMYAIAPLVTIALLRGRLAVAGIASVVGVLGKEFAAVPLAMFSAYAATRREWTRAASTLAWAGVVVLVWLTLQVVLIIRFNYGYGNNPSSDLLGGGYLAFWWSHETLRSALIAIVNEFGALYPLAAAGLVLAPSPLRRLSLIAIPPAAAFAYVQQPDRALWNFHFLVVPLSALVLERAPARLAWACAALFALANLRTGAQLTRLPASRYALAASMLLAVVSIGYAWHRGPVMSPIAPASVPGAPAST
jgi:hypothetical protein